MKELKCILYAEDSPQDAEMAVSALAEHHITNKIVVVADGVEALDFLFRRGRFQHRAEGDPAFVVLDLKMPRMDGLEVLRTIKRDERLRSIPVVMLTSSREEQDILQSYQLGVNAYIVKPVAFEAFIEAVKQLGAFWALHNTPSPFLPPTGTK